jgi:hypothetical protein
MKWLRLLCLRLVLRTAKTPKEQAEMLLAYLGYRDDHPIQALYMVAPPGSLPGDENYNPKTALPVPPELNRHIQLRRNRVNH